MTPPLADYTTLGLGGPAKSLVTADAEKDLIEAVRAADAGADPLLLIGGGSNLVISDEGFPGTVIHVNTRGIGYAEAGGGAIDVTVAAGEDWDGVVAASAAEGLAGLESLSGIPGRAGATPIQNVGAYGREVAEFITRVRVYDRQEDQILVLGNEQCSFAYRTSLFKSALPRYVVLDATFRLTRQALSLPVRYAELAAELGVALGERRGGRRGPLRRAQDPRPQGHGPQPRRSGHPQRRLVLHQPGDLRSASLAAVEAAAAARAAGPVPRYEAGDGLVKVPAAWLIEHAGFAKGYGAPAPARVSSKHTLALVNTGSATTAGLLALAREIVSGVHAAYGVTLTPEPILVGVTL